MVSNRCEAALQAASRVSAAAAASFQNETANLQACKQELERQARSLP
jgi:hypothetical protein